ncbi:hypothetical protein BJF84_27010 [Rhodococcus sp. CUA-806]|nr:hypothetical protein BJF84_27010 [Rhodococcus sp. CUA-806]
MWSNNTGGVATEDQRVASILTVDDFDDPAYRRMFTVITDLITAGQPYDPASVTAALMRSGADGAKDSALRRRLNEVITTGADGLAVVHYAGIVLSQSYRRSFHTAGQAIMQGAEELPEEDLSGSRAVLSHEYPAQSVKGISVTGSSLRGFGSVHDTGQSYGRYVPSHLIFRSALRPDVRHFRGHPAGAPVVVSPAVSWPGLLAFVATMMCRVSVRASR